jgi:4-amino-4-deoxy-L-arabinose transferase-like glycosyltransferase
MSESRKSWLSLLGLWLTLLVLAGLRPLALPDEGRYGDVGRWMLVSGDWLAPRLDGIPFFHKPPLLHWLQAITLNVAGVHAWSSRLVPALHAGLMLLSLYLAARHMAGERTARRAVWMLGTSLAFLIGGQYINHDMLVGTWIGIAVWCFGGAIMAGDKPAKGLALAGFAACALGVLSKGLIGLVLPGLVMFVWLSLTRQWAKAWRMPWLSGLLLFSAIALPWFVLGQQKYPGLFDYLIIGQHFGRYTGNTFNNQWPMWFYPMVLLALLFPWAFGVLWQGLAGVVRHKLALLKPASAWQALLWVWLISITVFFSLPRSKLVGYILPVIPPLTLLAAQYWEERFANKPKAPWVFGLLCALNLALGIGLNHLAAEHSLKRSSRDVAHALACRMNPHDTVIVAGGYPYDLPFEANLKHPVVVVSDWPQARKSAGDNWQREMFEGADFDPQAAQVLQGPEVLTQETAANRWLVTSRDVSSLGDLGRWHKVFEGRAWTLWQSAGSAGKSPETAEHKGLACSDHHRQEQRQK